MLLKMQLIMESVTCAFANHAVVTVSFGTLGAYHIAQKH